MARGHRPRPHFAGEVRGAEWVAVIHRWQLEVNRAERKALASFAPSCRNRTITVTLAG